MSLKYHLHVVRSDHTPLYIFLWCVSSVNLKQSAPLPVLPFIFNILTKEHIQNKRRASRAFVPQRTLSCEILFSPPSIKKSFSAVRQIHSFLNPIKLQQSSTKTCQHVGKRYTMWMTSSIQKNHPWFKREVDEQKVRPSDWQAFRKISVWKFTAAWNKLVFFYFLFVPRRQCYYMAQTHGNLKLTTFNKRLSASKNEYRKIERERNIKLNGSFNVILHFHFFRFFSFPNSFCSWPTFNHHHHQHQCSTFPRQFPTFIMTLC